MKFDNLLNSILEEYSTAGAMGAQSAGEPGGGAFGNYPVDGGSPASDPSGQPGYGGGPTDDARMPTGLSTVKRKDDIEENLSDVKIKSGKMKKILGLKDDEKITDKFSSGKDLAKALLSKIKDKKEVTGMLAFAANINKEKNIFDDALKSLKSL